MKQQGSSEPLCLPLLVWLLPCCCCLAQIVCLLEAQGVARMPTAVVHFQAIQAAHMRGLTATAHSRSVKPTCVRVSAAWRSCGSNWPASVFCSPAVCELSQSVCWPTIGGTLVMLLLCPAACNKPLGAACARSNTSVSSGCCEGICGSENKCEWRLWCLPRSLRFDVLCAVPAGMWHGRR